MANKELKSIRFPGLTDTYTVNGMPEVAGANMQLVTDADGVAKWEEKLAYANTSIKTPIEEQTVTTVENEGLYTVRLSCSLGIETGKTYTVNFDGTEYTCTASEFYGIVYIGNISIIGIGNNTEEPFFIGIQGAECELNTPSSGTHIISVIYESTSLKQIGAQYLPEIPADKLPDIPAEKLPEIPAEKLPTKHVISIAPDNSCSVSFTDAYNMVNAESASFSLGIFGGGSQIQTSYISNSQNISGTIQNAIIADIIKISDALSALQTAKLIWGESSGISVTTKQIPFQ